MACITQMQYLKYYLVELNLYLQFCIISQCLKGNVNYLLVALISTKYSTQWNVCLFSSTNLTLIQKFTFMKYKAPQILMTHIDFNLRLRVDSDLCICNLGSYGTSRKYGACPLRHEITFIVIILSFILVTPLAHALGRGICCYLSGIRQLHSFFFLLFMPFLQSVTSWNFKNENSLF